MTTFLFILIGVIAIAFYWAIYAIVREASKPINYDIPNDQIDGEIRRSNPDYLLNESLKEYRPDK